MRNAIAAVFLFVVSTGAAQVVLNEICPANADLIHDPDFYNFSPWVELYNPGSTNADISGFYLSDESQSPMKWRIPNGTSIPAKGFLLLWCDEMNTGRHASFSLDSEGGTVKLSNASGALLSEVSYARQFTNISYGRISEGAGAWAFLIEPTPGIKNNSANASYQLAKPTFSIEGGRHSTNVQVVLSHSITSAEIRYTTEGSEPTVNSTKASSSPITINKTQTLKAKAFLNGFIPSETATQTYFINEHAFTLPVISISTHPDYLYDNTIGIYVEGTNGVSGNCNDKPVNWNQDWERHAVFEYFDENGTRRFNQAVDIRIGGACSRNQAQKSLAIKARDKYGSNIMNYKFFNKSVNKFGGLMLRNSGNDFNVTMFRDALMQHLPVGQMDIDYMDYQPTIFYLNGQYMGIQNLREKIDADFFEGVNDVDKDNLDLIETYENALEGSPDAYLAYKNALVSMDRTTQAAYNFIDQHIDVQEFVNYLVAEIFYGNTDWPGNNIKFWRNAAVDGKFRWVLWDTDFGFALYENWSWPTHPTLDFATTPNGPAWPNPPWSTLHIRLLLENPQFRQRFIQTMNTALNTTFHPDRVISIIDQFQQRIATEMPYHRARWWGGMNEWNAEVERLRTFARIRNTYMRQHMADFFGLNGTINISTAIEQGEGMLRINEITSEARRDQPYVRDMPIRIEPVAAVGYAFKEWKITKAQSESVSLIQLGANWKYFDQGNMPAGWSGAEFDDALWPEGQAQLGYGEGDEQAIVSFGPDGGNKYVTTYFRKTFMVPDTTGFTQISGSVLVDDGAVIYLNGVEVGRVNMPEGAVDYSTFSLNLTVEGAYSAFNIAKGLIKPGFNVLAVEVHQVGVNSSDLSFDLDLSTRRLGNMTVETSTTPVQIDTAFTDISYEAYFEPSAAAVTGIVINEISTIPSKLLDEDGDAEDWIELYNAGTQTVNLAGLYITDNLNSRTKHMFPVGQGSELVMQPGDYKILWADDDASSGANHLKFKLSNEGEAVGLYQVIGDHILTIDEYVYNSQVVRGSFSRIPNATGNFVFTPVSTPDEMNEIIVSGIEDDEFAISIYPNPVRDYLYIDSPDLIERVQLLDCLGRTVEEFSGARQYQVSLADHVPGIYLLRIQSANHARVVRILKE